MNKRIFLIICSALFVSDNVYSMQTEEQKNNDIIIVSNQDLEILHKKFFDAAKNGDVEELKKKLPLKVDELLRVESLGPKKIKTLYRELGVKNLKDLEKVAKAHKISPLFGFGEKTEKNILQGLEFLKQNDLLPSLIVTSPDKPQGRKMLITPPPVKVWAIENNIPYIQPEKLSKEEIGGNGSPTGELREGLRGTEPDTGPKGERNLPTGRPLPG